MIDRFTPAQQQAITAGDGPLAIIAGPGCGPFTAEAAHRLRHEVGRQRGGSLPI
jgi:superfamily I DNA/RNA helicase